jgi:hypothetical protein
MKKKKHTKKQGNSLVFQQYGNGGLHDIGDGTNICMYVQEKKNKRLNEASIR